MFMSPRQNSHQNGHRAPASTNDILGPAKTPPKINPKWKEHYDRLVELRDFLSRHRGDLAESAKQEQPVFSLHMADAGTDQYDQDFALSMISSDQNALYEIEEALARIRSGTYGVCELTGKPIEADRLVAIPWTRFSIEAQKQLEENGSVQNTRFGKRAQFMEGDVEEEEEEEE